MRRCAQCGEAVAPDPFGSPGVLVHDPDELGIDRAVDLDEDHVPLAALHYDSEMRR